MKGIKKFIFNVREKEIPDFNSSKSEENVEIQHDIAPKDLELQIKRYSVF